MSSKLGATIYNEWGNAALAYVDEMKGSDPAEAYFFIEADKTTTILKKVPATVKNALVVAYRELSRDKAVLAELDADKKYQYFERQIPRTKNKKAADKLIEKMEEFITQNEGTRAATKANDAITELRKLK